MTNNTILTLSIISTLLAFNCQAETIQPVDAVSKSLTFESSLSKFKSLNTEINKSLTNEDAADIVDAEEMNQSKMDHSKMSADEIKNMDHNMGAAEMKDKNTMDHSKMNHDSMTPEQIKEMPKATINPIKQKKLKSIQKKIKPTQAPVDAHQNHQM